MKFLSCQQCREADRIAIEELGVSGLTLMENAGRGCADAILDMNLKSEVAILCGRGNNGGDGYVIARHLHATGMKVTVLLLASSQNVTGDALVNLNRLAETSVEVIELPSDSNENRIRTLLTGDESSPPGIIVDAMLGTGATGGLRSPYDRVVKIANKMDAVRVAVDLPSGLDSDTGQVANNAFLADLTCTFIGLKQGMNTDTGRRYCGEIRLIDIGLPQQALDRASQ